MSEMFPCAECGVQTATAELCRGGFEGDDLYYLCLRCFHADENPPCDDDDGYAQEESEMDYWLHKCGWIRSERICTAAGSEMCDWECPFSREYHETGGRGRAG